VLLNGTIGYNVFLQNIMGRSGSSYTFSL